MRIMLCAAILGYGMMNHTAIAENGDQAPPRDNTPKISINSGIFSFSKGLDSIMKPDTTIPKPAQKPARGEQKQQIAHIKSPPKPPRKPEQNAKKPELSAASNIQPPESLKEHDLEDIEASLSDRDVERYKEVFALQQKGEMKAANDVFEKIENPILAGYVLAQRYLHPNAYVANFDELRKWLESYADHPDAPRLYELAERKRPAGNNSRLNEPRTKIQISRRAEPTMIIAKRYSSARQRNSEEAQTVRNLQQTITRQIRANELSSAQSAIEQSGNLDTVETDILTARLAAAYLYKGQTSKAFSLASKASSRSGLHVPLASWVAGLVSWKRGKYTSAAKYFETVARSNYASGWTRSAGAYWAARSHMRRGDIKAVSVWLRRAAKSPRTFYGLIATRALGEDFNFNWDMPRFSKEYYEILSSELRGARAIALVKIGERTNAQAELLRINPQSSASMASAMLSFAGHAKLPGVAMRLGAMPANKTQGIYHDAALYPTVPWQPESGYKLTASLFHAIMRQESRFDPAAKSGSGARGLMQLMPATAKSVADHDEPNMQDPAINLELGQRYLIQLLNAPHINNNLLSLLVAYNAGPGNLKKWKRHWSKIDDPLLFIELLPSGETRSYVEHVLSNYWIYRMRANQPTPTLDAVVAGTPVKFDS